MCEETASYLWAEKDVLGRGATSQVFKAYNKATGELVAAKVYPVSSNSRSQAGGQQNAREKDFRRILDREMDILKDTKHENIVRYIGVEPVKYSDSAPNSAREALFIEYCNGGSLHHVLESFENRYGLMDDEFMLVFKHLTSALRYLRDKNTIHRDIKPDNIMLSININGERTYKLADLGVARLINEGENAFTSIVGTEEYIHPVLYQAAIPDKDVNVLPTTLQTRVNFPFEVDLWSFGVTLYQCAAGELPFQPFAGTRKDRTVMRRILDSKPEGFISGVEKAPGENIEWSKTLPNTCRLSPSLKRRVEFLLQRLLESKVTKLMKFEEFFKETDRIINLIPIYYLNLKRFQLTCGYFEPKQTILKLYDELLEQNGDNHTVKYNCLFQNVPYPISKTEPISIEMFCNQLPIPTSCENPLVFYTFSPWRDSSSFRPDFHMPEVKAIRQNNDVAAACEWAKDLVGLFFYMKDQLFQYQHILQTAQSSSIMMQLHLKSELLEFLCAIRSKLIDLRTIEELKSTLDQIDNSTTGQMVSSSSSSMISSVADGSHGRTHSASGEVPAIGFSHFLTNDATSSPGAMRRPASTSSMQLVQQSIRIHLRSYRQPYEELQKCEQSILDMIKKQSGGKTVTSDDQELFASTGWSSDHTTHYTTQIRRTDKLLRDLKDLYESFCQDRLLSTYNRLQIDSHYLRRNKFEQLYNDFKNFATRECYPTLISIACDYNEWIKLHSNIINEFEHIRETYEKQCENMIGYVDMIDNLRKIVYQNIRGLSSASSFSSSSELNQPPSGVVRLDQHPIPENLRDNQSQLSTSSDQENPEGTNKTLMHKIRGTTKKTIQHAEESLSKLDDVIKQLRTNMQRK